ncbi:MAG: hypothetical protein ACT4PK_01245, partial [Gammaproteobacteria bacterium]
MRYIAIGLIVLMAVGVWSYRKFFSAPAPGSPAAAAETPAAGAPAAPPPRPPPRLPGEPAVVECAPHAHGHHPGGR